ncbi:MAG: SLATT domain-containing protein [Microscillaceae bacterium]|nr:SLATT domain-containing protein [Microscillaceae bacterium]
MAYEENNPYQNADFSDENHFNPFHFASSKGQQELTPNFHEDLHQGDPFDGVESIFIAKKGFLNFIKSAAEAKTGGFLGFIEDVQAQRKEGGFINFLKEVKEHYSQNQGNTQNYNNPNYNNPNQNYNNLDQNYNNPNYNNPNTNQNYNNPNYNNPNQNYNNLDQNYNNPNYNNPNYNNPNYNNPNYVNQNYNNPNVGNQNYNNPNPGNQNTNNLNPGNQNYNTTVANNNPQANTPFFQAGTPNPNQAIVPIKQPGSEGYVDPFDDLATRLEHAKKVVEGINDTMAELLSPVSGPVVPVISQFKKDPNQDGFESLNERLFYSGKERTKNTEEEKLEIKEKLEYLKVKIQLDSFKYRGWEKKSKNWALIFRLMSSALAAVVTVLLGFNVTDTMRDYGIDWYINTVALIITAFISIIGVIQGFFDANELYIKYTDTANKLEHLGSTIEYLELGMDYASIDDVNALKIEYDEIIESTHDYEVRVRAKEQEGFNQGKFSRGVSGPSK